MNETAYQRIKHWTISDLREYVLNDEVTSDDIAFVRKGLTSEVVAAVAKICSNADLIYGGKKMPVIKKPIPPSVCRGPLAAACSRTIPATMCRVLPRKSMKGSPSARATR